MKFIEKKLMIFISLLISEGPETICITKGMTCTKFTREVSTILVQIASNPFLNHYLNKNIDNRPKISIKFVPLRIAMLAFILLLSLNSEHSVVQVDLQLFGSEVADVHMHGEVLVVVSDLKISFFIQIDLLFSKI